MAIDDKASHEKGEDEDVMERYMKNPYSMEESLGEVESVRDIRKGVMDRGFCQRHDSAPIKSDLMYPEYSVSSLAQPGGFRRHAVEARSNETGENNDTTTHQRPSLLAKRFEAFIDLLPLFPVIGKDEDGGGEGGLTAAHKTGSVKAFFTLFKAYCGGGLVYYPRGFSLAGLLPSWIIMFTVAFFSTLCSFILLSTKRVMENRGYRNINTYQDLAMATMGPTGLWICNTTVVCSQMGFVCTYFLYVANYAQMLVRQLTNCETNPEVWTLCLCATPFLYLLVLVRHIKYFAPIALAADAFIVLVVIYLMAYDGTQLHAHGTGDWEVFANWPGTLMLLGTTCYAFEGTVMVIPIQNSMRNPSKFPLVFLSVMLVYMSLIMVLGTVHYVLNGSNTGTLALENLPMASTGAKVLTALYLFVVFFTFPIQMYTISITVDKWCGFRALRSGRKWHKNGARLALLLLALGISIGTANFLDYVIAIMGAALCVPLALLFPPLMAYYVKRGWTQLDQEAQGETEVWTVTSPAAAGSANATDFAASDFSGGPGGDELKTPLLGGEEEEPGLGGKGKLVDGGDVMEAGGEEASSAVILSGGTARVDEEGDSSHPLLRINLSKGVLVGMVGVAGVAAMLGTVMAVYSMLHPDQDPITQDEYCGFNTTSIAVPSSSGLNW